MTRSALVFGLWTIAAGAGIPFIGLLNAGVARSLGNPLSASALMFAVAFAASAALALPLHGVPSVNQLTSAPPVSYGAGLLIAFYGLSATIIIPRLGASKFIALILLAQLVTAGIVDQFGLLGVTRNPLTILKLCGFGCIIGGVAAVQFNAIR